MQKNKTVLVIGMNGRGLMPCTPRKARILLKENNVFAAGLVAATAALLPFVKSERFAYWKGKAIQKGRTL